MTSHLRNIILFVPLATTMVSCDTAHGSAPLSLRLPAADARTFEMSLDQKIRQTIQGADQVMQQTMQFVWRQVVESVDADGNMDLAMTYEAIRFVQDAPGLGRTEYDSRTPPENVPPMARGFAALVGRGFVLRVTPKGQILDVDGVDEMVEGMLASLEAPPGTDLAMLAEQLRKQFSDQILKETFQPLMGFYPENPVDAGDRWAKTFAMAKIFPHVQINEYELTERGDHGDVIRLTGTIKPNENGDPMALGPLSLAPLLTGTHSGTFSVERDTGFLVALDYEQAMSGQFVGETGGESFEVPVQVDSTITIRSL